MDIQFESDEIILNQSRKHWFVFLVEVFGIIIAIFAPLILFSIATILPIHFSAEGSALVLFLFLYIVWFFIMWNILFIIWTDYYLDILIVTNKRILDIEQKGIFNREISTLRLSKIQDVTTEVSGFIATFFNFGDVHIQTAGQQREFIVRNIYKPEKARTAVNEAIDHYRSHEYGVKDLD